MKVIGVDVGYGHTKVVSAAGQHVFPSLVGKFEERYNTPGLKTALDIVTVLGEGKYLVGESAGVHAQRFLTSRSIDWIKSAAWKALFHRALDVAKAKEADDLMIVTGLPPAYFQMHRVELSAIVKAAAEYHCDRCTVHVLPQPLGSFFSIFLDASGKLSAKAKDKRVGIVDVGFYTVDFFTIYDLQPVVSEIDSLEGGVSSALELLSRDVFSKFTLKMTLAAADKAARAGTVKIAGADKDIGALVTARLDELSEQIRARTSDLWGGGQNLDAILVTGGGAALLKSHLNGSFPKNSVYLSKSQFANAEGYYKFGLRGHR